MSDPARVARIQAAVEEAGVSAWLLFDFHGTNPIARRVLGCDLDPHASKTTRRWFYLVPAAGDPVKLVHRLEPAALDHLPGRTRVYLTWQELERSLADAIGALGRAGQPVVAMEYSESARLPYVSRVDAGTVELVRAAGARVATSADLAQRFDGVLDPAARQDHRRTGGVLHGIMSAAFEHAGRCAKAGRPTTEMGLQRWILKRFEAEGLVSSDPPVVAVDVHSAEAHYVTSPARDLPIGAGCCLLLDAWAKAARSGAVYADYTQVAFFGLSAPEPHRAAFAAVREARDAAIAHVRDAVRSGRAVRGCDVDDAARSVIRARGLADRFFHRTGHSIGEEVHGNGVHLDNLETRDERRLLDGTLVSVEPGVYLEAFGVRSEVNLLVDGGTVAVTTEPIQEEIFLLGA